MSQYCKACNQELPDTMTTCPLCGAELKKETYDRSVIPDGVKGWSWGAFLLNWIWAIFNRTWIGLFALVPYVGFIMAIVLGFKGREWAWKNKEWASLEEFNRVQRNWSVWGGILLLIIFILGILAAIALPSYSDYNKRATVMKAVVVVSAYRAEVTEFYTANNRLPTELADLNPTMLPKMPNSPVISVDILGDGVIVAELEPDLGENAFISLTPKANCAANTCNLDWICTSNLRPHWLPQQCRSPMPF
jgi:Tfp pilus assembly protein PilE